MCFQMIGNAIGTISEAEAAQRIDKLRNRAMGVYRGSEGQNLTDYYNQVKELGNKMGTAGLEQQTAEEQAHREASINDIKPQNVDLQLGDMAQKNLASSYNDILNNARTRGVLLARRGALDDAMFANKLRGVNTDQTLNNISYKAKDAMQALQFALAKAAADRHYLFLQMHGDMAKGTGNFAQSMMGGMGSGGGMGMGVGGMGGGGGAQPGVFGSNLGNFQQGNFANPTLAYGGSGFGTNMNSSGFGVKADLGKSLFY